MTIADNPALVRNEAPPTPAAGLLGAVTTAYEDAGYHAGYSAAVRDYLSLLFATADELLQQADAHDAEVRLIVYRLISRVQERMESSTTSAPFVEGGLGI